MKSGKIGRGGGVEKDVLRVLLRRKQKKLMKVSRQCPLVLLVKVGWR
jgi:hypothetical protein